ncbi:MAG: class I SAM-dependent methyltransferase [Gammaproteobacteria bacterium]|nr:class I SAM-dependent methyltransferase [Gammaproteobacteria bacterium]
MNSHKSPELLDSRLSNEFLRRLDRYMGDYDPSSTFANKYLNWYEDHSGRRSDWFRTDLIWRLELTRPLAGRKVLDFGCGTGSSSVVLADRGAEVVGVETEQISIDVATQRAKDLRVEERCSFVRIPYINGQSGALPFRDESFDLCILIGVLEHMKPSERIACAAEINRVLKAEGDVFIFDTPNRAHPKDHHTTQLWFVGWMPESVARRYAILRQRFEQNQDFRRYGGNGVSRSQIDHLFPPRAWRVTYEKSAEEVTGEFERLLNQSTILPTPFRKTANWWAKVATRQFLKVVKFLGCRPTYWTASHTICFTKLPDIDTASGANCKQELDRRSMTAGKKN